MPDKLGPRRGWRDTRMAEANCLGVRLRLAQRDPDLSALTEAASEHDDLGDGLFVLVANMARPAGRHPELAGAA